MAKRFTDTELENKLWFINLPPRLKCLVRYVQNKCDQVGVWDPNFQNASRDIGEPVTEQELLRIDNGGQFTKLETGKIFIPDFVSFQYGELKENCKPHQYYIKLLRKHNLLHTLTKGLNKGLVTLKEKDTEKETEKETDFGKSENLLPAYPEHKPENDREANWCAWTELILAGRDQFFEGLFIAEVRSNQRFTARPEWIKQHITKALRERWNLDTQTAFRISLIGYLRTCNNSEKNNGGFGFNKQAPVTDIVYTPSYQKPETIGEVKAPIQEEQSLEEKQSEARKQMEILIDKDFTRFCENENCQIQFAGLEFDFLQKQGKIRVNKEQREEYERQAVEIRMIRLGGVVDPIRNPMREVKDSSSKLLLDQYKQGRIPDGDLLSMKAVAKELALRDYFRQLKQQEEQMELVETVTSK